MYAEVPDETVHALLAKQLRHGIFAGLERRLWRQLDPTFAKLFRAGRNRILLLIGFAGYANLNCGDYSLVALWLHANNAEPVPRKLRCRSFGVGVFFVARINIYVDRRQ